eukprot:8104965-Prorocentrum_lima.AAC.1
MGGTSAPSASSAPLTTTWTTVADDDANRPPPGSWTPAGPPDWANSDVEEDEAPLLPDPSAACSRLARGGP